MKKILLVLMAIAMTVSFMTGCQKKEETIEKPELIEPENKEEKPVLGGWTVNSDVVTVVYPTEAGEAFEKASKEYNGIEMEPVALLASQVVSGKNYSFLAKTKNVASNGQSQWFIVVVYEDLQGNAKITSANPIDISDIKVGNTIPENLLGGWELAPVSNAVTLPEEIWSKFSEASEGFVGVNLSPLAVLASQVVSGANYLILCTGNTVTQNPQYGLYVVTLYVDAQGKAQLTNVDIFDVLAYE